MRLGQEGSEGDLSKNRYFTPITAIMAFKQKDKYKINKRWNSNRVLIFWIKTNMSLFSSSSRIDCTLLQVVQLNFRKNSNASACRAKKVSRLTALFQFFSLFVEFFCNRRKQVHRCTVVTDLLLFPLHWLTTFLFHFFFKLKIIKTFILEFNSIFFKASTTRQFTGFPC